MIEVMCPQDIEKITSPVVQTYLHKRFKEIGYVIDPEIEGYFIYVPDFAQLHQTQDLTYLILPSIEEGLFDRPEGISITGDIVEVSLLFNNEFLISLVFYRLSPGEFEIITKENEK